MAPPANDTRASAQLVPVGSYWGVVTGGTTVDATEDAGGPVDGFGAQDVFYYWSSLPAGQVFVHVQPQPGHEGTYFEAALASVAPTDWDSAVEWIGSGYWGPAVSDPDFPCVFQGTHSGGPLSLVVYSFTGDMTGSDTVFDFGWGHELDSTASHWGGDQTEDWTLRENDEFTGYIAGGPAPLGTRYGIDRAYSQNAGPTVPVGHAACTYDNARSGVVHLPTLPTVGCSDEGDGVGGTESDLGGVPSFAYDVGQVYSTDAGNPVIPDITTRQDVSVTSQTVWAFRLNDHQRGPIVEDDQVPDTFFAYAIANDRVDGFVWGYQFEADEWETRNFHFGSWQLTNPAGGDVDDPCTVKLRALPQGVVWDTEATVTGAQNRVFLDDGDLNLTGGFSPSWVGADDAGTDVWFSLPDTGDFELDVADYVDLQPFLRHADGSPTDRWVVAVMIADETVDNTPPTFDDPALFGSYVATGSRQLLDGSGGATPASFESRVPTWRPYLGFPLAQPGGWYVGKVGAGGPA